jgi:hypothetical protein
MAAETAPIRDKTRRVKDHILTRYLNLADKVDRQEPLLRDDKELYLELTMKFAANVVPRSVEHGGDPDNETPIPILMKTNVPTDNSNGENSQAPKAD